MPPRDVEQQKYLMVAMELIMVLLSLLYAFPHVPATLLDDDADDDDYDERAPAAGEGAMTWFNVSSTGALRSAVDALLHTSDVLEVSMRPGLSVEDVTRDTIADPLKLSDAFGLRLYQDDRVPATCRQMYEGIAATYKALNESDVATRTDLWTLYQRYQLIPVGYQLPGMVRVEKPNRSALLRFCSELAVDWLQPYVAQKPGFYVPDASGAIACTARA